MQNNMQRNTPALSPQRAGRREAADARGEQGAAEEYHEGAPTKR